MYHPSLWCRVGPDFVFIVFRCPEAYCKAISHSDMNLFVPPLSPPATPGALPRPAGEPRAATAGRGEWHVHNGGWSPDSKQVIYTRDTDTADIYLLEGAL